MARKIFKGVWLLFINPVLFLKYLRKFFFERVIFAFFRPPLHFVKNIRGVIFEADFKSFPQDKGFQECVKEIYFDTYEVEVREYMEKILKTGDIFVDVGASAGYLSAIGASLVKESGQVHCFEPAPILFQSLGKLPLKNPKYKIIVNNCALGDKTGTIKFNYAAFPSLGGSSIVPGFLEFHHISKVQTIDVPIMRLDEYLQGNNLESVALIKIDVEGYEFPVLKGLQKYFENTDYRPPIICEITPSAYLLLGTSRQELIDYMKQYGYEAYNIMAPWRKVDITKFKEGTNVIWKAV